jgi:hypothetical protein
VSPRPAVLVAGNKRTMTPVPVAVVATMVLAGLAGCGSSRVTGEGPVQSETRNADPFTRIEVSGGISVTVRIGPTQALEVSAQENILPVIATDVEGDTLRIRSTESYSTSEGVEVAVATPALVGISMSGGSRGRIEGLDAERLDIGLSGGAGLTATGTATSVALNMTGGSRASLENLTASTITLDLSGGTTATVQASDRVSGSASGGSRVSVLGDAQLNVEVSGGGEVRRD